MFDLEITQEDSIFPDIEKTVEYMLSLQRSDGYWWFTLEANETIGAEFIFLMHFLDEVDPTILKGIARRILDVQRIDGTWALYKDGPADLSTTVECYFALKLAGIDIDLPIMQKARDFILSKGGIEKTRVFTKIHLALFGIVPWNAVPAMPAEFILLPNWFPVNIYEFSSWARATIVPLLVVVSQRITRKLAENQLVEELFVNPPGKRNYSFRTEKGLISPEYFFILIDKCLKVIERIPFRILRNLAYHKCLKWTREHINDTEDIYPALSYAALAFKVMGYKNTDIQIKKPFNALKMFHQYYTTKDIPALPDEILANHHMPPSQLRELGIDPRTSSELSRRGVLQYAPTKDAEQRIAIHQQCCISPVWDTPWMIIALLESQVSPSHPALVRSGRWLINKQITDVLGDWKIKNPNAKPGGWSFEFENGYFPDVDDTIEVLHALKRLHISEEEKDKPIQLGIDWIISMQNDDGGWAAFDKNQTQEIVNRIPFSDHGACLDPSCPDITGRMLELLASFGFDLDNSIVSKAIDYIWHSQENFGGWHARWGINYIYGTWCVLTGLSTIGFDMNDERVKKSVDWIKSIQNIDGGFGESPESYTQKKYVPWRESVPSQTAWGLMSLVAAGESNDPVTKKAAKFLLDSRNENKSWDENHYTGTGFPGHFYIRYHGYRHYFPLLALARYFRMIS